MRMSRSAALFSGFLIGLAAAASASASEQIIPVVHSAQAAYASPARRTIVVRATVDLPDSCWSNPRFSRPSRHVRPDTDGVVQIAIVADSSARPGIMCAMIYRPAVAVRPLRWTTFPHGLTSVRLVGQRTSVTVEVGANGPAE